MKATTINMNSVRLKQQEKMENETQGPEKASEENGSTQFKTSFLEEQAKATEEISTTEKPNLIRTSQSAKTNFRINGAKKSMTVIQEGPNMDILQEKRRGFVEKRSKTDSVKSTKLKRESTREHFLDEAGASNQHQSAGSDNERLMYTSPSDFPLDYMDNQMNLW